MGLEVSRPCTSFRIPQVVASDVALACGVRPEEQAHSHRSLWSSTFPHCLPGFFSVFPGKFSSYFQVT